MKRNIIKIKELKLASLPDFPDEFPKKYIDEAEDLFNKKFNESMDLILNLKTIYSFIDKINSEYIKNYVSCSKGCSHCCNMDVQLTALEAIFISNSIGIEARQNPLTIGHKSPCPFLSEEKKCMIYSLRPLFCRTYHSASDPALCHTPGAYFVQYGSLETNMGNIVFKGAYEWIQHQNNYAARGLILDIRDFFPYSKKIIQSALLNK